MELLKKFAGEKRNLYIISVVLAILSVICGIVPYLIIGDIVSKIFDGYKEFDVYLMDVVIMGLSWILKELFHSLSTTCSHIATFHVLGNIRKACLDKLSKVPLGYVLENPSGSLKNIIVERVDSVETTLAHILPEFTSNLLAPVVMFVVLVTIDWRMALISLITLPLSLICYMGMMIGYEESWKNAITKTKILNDTAVEYINGIEVIKVFGKAKASYEKFVIAAKEGASCYVDWMRRSNIFFCIAMTLAPYTLVSVLPLGGLFVLNGSLSVNDYVICIVLSMGLIAPLITVMAYSDDLAKLRTVTSEINDILSKDELVRPEHDKDTVNSYDIELKNVTFGYRDKEVLHGIHMNIKEGSVNAIVGPSGSGKSTIAKLIASLWDVNGGSISIGGVDIKDLSLDSYYQYVAYVSQDNFLFNDTIKENIRLGNLNASDEDIYNIAKECGCYDFIMSLDHGFDTVVGGAGGHLSGGERQRISIARAMLKNAPIIILDEATAYTDPENEALVQSSIAKLVKDKTLIVIAHRLSTVKDSDQIIVINNGMVEASGTHDQLLNNCQLYKNMWEAHIQTKDDIQGGIIHV